MLHHTSLRALFHTPVHLFFSFFILNKENRKKVTMMLFLVQDILEMVESLAGI